MKSALDVLYTAADLLSDHPNKHGREVAYSLLDLAEAAHAQNKLGDDSGLLLFAGFDILARVRRAPPASKLSLVASCLLKALSPLTERVPSLTEVVFLWHRVVQIFEEQAVTCPREQRAKWLLYARVWRDGLEDLDEFGRSLGRPRPRGASTGSPASR